MPPRGWEGFYSGGSGDRLWDGSAHIDWARLSRWAGGWPLDGGWVDVVGCPVPGGWLLPGALGRLDVEGR